MSRTRLFALLFPLVAAVGCGRQETAVNKVGLAPLDVRDSSFGDGSTAPGAPGSKGNGTGTSGANGANLIDSTAAFQQTVYPLLTQWCAGCHATVQSPFFAQTDVQKSHDALLVSQKVDMVNVGDSRIVLRLSQDEHNCPVSPGCAAAATQMEAAINQWIKLSQKPSTGNPAQLPTTATLSMADAKMTTIPGGNPAGVILETAKQFTLTAPYVSTAVATAFDGTVFGSAASGTTDTNATTAATDVNLGTATVNFNVTTAGAYQVQGYVSGVAGSSSVWVQMDAGALQTFAFAPTAAATYEWATAAAKAGGTPLSFNLAAGAHKLVIKQRQAGATVDRIVISNNPAFDPSGAQPATINVNLLTFDLSGLTKIQGAQLTVQVSDYSDTAYMFNQPKLVLPSGSVFVEDMRLAINGVSNPENSTYSIVNTTVQAPGGVLVNAAMVALKDKGDASDQFAFTFGTIEAK